MIKRVVDISSPSRLRVEYEQLVIERKEEKAVTVPLEDIGILILDNPAISHTQGLMSACCSQNIAVVFSNDKHLPGGLLLPMTGHTLHSRTINQQMNTSEPICKKLWQQIIRAKIKGQAQVLEEIHGENTPLPDLVRQVQSGDPQNVEGRAAQIYWKKLFGSKFRRDPESEGVNSLLNYGYAIIRAATARAIVGTGLHPALGIHHHNQYDSFCLADDLMEPLRPAIDRIVYRIWDANDDQVKIDKETKQKILEISGELFILKQKKLPLIIALHSYAASIRKLLCEKSKGNPEIPEMR
jgi:CRISP-associated protein Cas1